MEKDMLILCLDQKNSLIPVFYQEMNWKSATKMAIGTQKVLLLRLQEMKKFAFNSQIIKHLLQKINLHTRLNLYGSQLLIIEWKKD